MKLLFHFKYPKLLILSISVILAYYLFSRPFAADFIKSYGGDGFVWMFTAGFLFSFGFTTPFAVGYFLTASPENIFLAALAGSFGALLCDMLIFKLIKLSFLAEFNRLEKEIFGKKIDLFLKAPSHFKAYLLYFFAGIIIASPIPNEIGVSLLAGLTKIRPLVFSFVSFTMNFLGILAMLSVGKYF